jgi:hypothetical protein
LSRNIETQRTRVGGGDKSGGDGDDDDDDGDDGCTPDIVKVVKGAGQLSPSEAAFLVGWANGVQHTHARAHARTNTYTHTHTHTHTHKQGEMPKPPPAM